MITRCQEKAIVSHANCVPPGSLPRVRIYTGDTASRGSSLAFGLKDAEYPSAEIWSFRMKLFELPDSSLLTDAERAALKLANQDLDELRSVFADHQPLAHVPLAGVAATRRLQADAFYRSSIYSRLRDRFAVTLATTELAGIDIEVFTPADSIGIRNGRRLLINLHGGGFQIGSRINSHLESIPIAALGRIKVLSVDYRMAPEHRFPAATDDVLAVYRLLLEDYDPNRIGVYGCSAGAVLTAQVTSRLLKEGLPLPGAIGMFCGAGTYWFEGDAGQISPIISDSSFMGLADDPYFQGTNPDDPLAFPARSPSLLSKFPPSLLLSSTRDLALSSVVHTHSLLVQQGVRADLHVWEGLGHAFHYYPDLPQSRAAYDVICRFFDNQLGI